MAVSAKRSYEPIMPTEQDAMIAQQCSRILAPHVGGKDSVHLRLDDGTDIILPASMMRFMVDALVQMAQGNAVTLIPIHAELTTQQAADILNVSRPYLVDELLEKGEIPFRKVGMRRRVLFKDVMAYKNRIDNARLDTLAKLVEHDQEYEQFGYGL